MSYITHASVLLKKKIIKLTKNNVTGRLSLPLWAFSLVRRPLARAEASEESGGRDSQALH